MSDAGHVSGMTFDIAIAAMFANNGPNVARCSLWRPNIYLDTIGDGKFTVWQRRLGNDASRIVEKDTGRDISDAERAADWELVPLHTVPRLDNEIGVRIA